MSTSNLVVGSLPAAFDKFRQKFEPRQNDLPIVIDKCTGAKYCECLVRASKLMALATTDVPLDPEDEEFYRANREPVVNAPAFLKMVEDAKRGRSFSNIVAEYTEEFDDTHPLKIIGGQHRFAAIQAALSEGQDEYHGVKVYFNLTKDQRVDVQLISNTNIAISKDWIDRVQDTAKGGALRDWCQNVGLLKPGQQFTDQYRRGGAISVQMARTFITNFYVGKGVLAKDFESTDTTAIKCPAGKLYDDAWETLLTKQPNMWKDDALARAAREFVALLNAQRSAFAGKQLRPKPDYPEKGMNLAVLAAWAYVAGVLQSNLVRLERHFSLQKTKGHDPLNAEVLAHGRHKTDDPDNYRGLGYRTDAKQCGRLVELFYYQAEEGKGIKKHTVDVAIASYHAKRPRISLLKVKQEK
jgi:hypothetical protein